MVNISDLNIKHVCDITYNNTSVTHSVNDMLIGTCYVSPATQCWIQCEQCHTHVQIQDRTPQSQAKIRSNNMEIRMSIRKRCMLASSSILVGGQPSGASTSESTRFSSMTCVTSTFSWVDSLSSTSTNSKTTMYVSHQHVSNCAHKFHLL